MVATADRFICVFCPDLARSERVMAEAWEAGAQGVLEEEDAESVRLTIYMSSQAESLITETLQKFKPEGVQLLEAQSVPEENWSETWKEGLNAIEISSRLVVRPPFIDYALLPGQKEVVINPGQAFGTGRHESTRLALDWVDALAGSSKSLGRTLDVGAGSGVLAMAALQLGAVSAVGFDLDAVAMAEAREQSKNNPSDSPISFFTGPIDALRAVPFDLVLVNMLRTEMEPITREISDRVEGRLVLSGLLESDCRSIIETFQNHGLQLRGVRNRIDDSGNTWSGLLLERA